MAFFSFWQVSYEIGHLRTASSLNHDCYDLVLWSAQACLRNIRMIPIPLEELEQAPTLQNGHGTNWFEEKG
jgi:hypothetical protein